MFYAFFVLRLFSLHDNLLFLSLSASIINLFLMWNSHWTFPLYSFYIFLSHLFSPLYRKLHTETKDIGRRFSRYKGSLLYIQSYSPTQEPNPHSAKLVHTEKDVLLRFPHRHAWLSIIALSSSYKNFIYVSSPSFSYL